MNKPVHPADGTYCPLWRKPRAKVCHTCAWWTQVLGKNPQTKQDVNEWNCAIALMPMLQIETTMTTREAASETHELRNEVQQANSSGMASALMGINGQLRAMTPPALPNAAPPKLLEN